MGYFVLFTLHANYEESEQTFCLIPLLHSILINYFLMAFPLTSKTMASVERLCSGGERGEYCFKFRSDQYVIVIGTVVGVTRIKSRNTGL